MAQLPQSDPTKVFGRRILAALIDAAIVLIPAAALVTASFEYLEEEALGARSGEQFCDDYLDVENGFCVDFTAVDDRVYFADTIDGSATIAYWGITFLLLVVLQGLTGWTPGKLLTGIRTVRDDGRPAGLVKAFVRWVLWIVDAFPYFLPLVGFITALTTVGHRRVGDMVAKTFVVRSSAMGSPISVPGLTAPPPPVGYGSATPWEAQSTTPWGAQATSPPPPPGAAWGAPPPPAPPPPEENDPLAEGWAAPTDGAPGLSDEPVTDEPVAAQAPPPQWDEARGTYIQWDPAQSAWLQWNDSAKTWSRIPGQ